MALQHPARQRNEHIAYPITRQFRQELYDEIVKKFNVVMKQET